MNKLVLLLALLAGCARPDFYDTNGKGYRYEQLRGNWFVINYWATWCAPCVKEIPELVALGENHDDIVVMGVNFDAPEDDDEMAAQIEKMKITFPVMAGDPHRYYGIDPPQVMPTTLIVDPDGMLTDLLIGPQTQASLLAAMGRQANL